MIITCPACRGEYPRSQALIRCPHCSAFRPAPKERRSFGLRYVRIRGTLGAHVYAEIAQMILNVESEEPAA
jgi:hypothetical protein